MGAHNGKLMWKSETELFHFYVNIFFKKKVEKCQISEKIGPNYAGLIPICDKIN